MNRRESEQLLDDVMSDAAPAEFRAGLLELTLRQVRRRNRIRGWIKGVVVAAALLAVVSFALWRTSSPSNQRAEMQKPDLIVVRSRPLGSSMIVETRPGMVSVVASSPSTFELVETGKTRSVLQEIDDEGLLALLQGRPVALVRHGPNQAELIFLNPEDQKGFPVQ